MSQCSFHITPGHWANIIPVIFLSSLGNIHPELQVLQCFSGSSQTQYQPLPLTGTHIYSWANRSLSCSRTQVPLVATRIRNPHSDDSAVVTQIRCTEPFGLGTAPPTLSTTTHTGTHAILLRWGTWSMTQAPWSRPGLKSKEWIASFQLTVQSELNPLWTRLSKKNPTKALLIS